MGSSTGYIMTISNSIIGVSVLAMPFCYKECGIVLSSLLLILSNILSRSTCHFLLKSAIMSRRRNYELLAFQVFGTMGKTLVELSIIGFMMGTCIAFFVVMGDLGPAILSNVFTHIRIETLRPTVLMIAESSTHLIQGEWIYEVKYWNPGGLLQCLPIFSMALFCQTQLFDIFESMPNLSLDRMNEYIGSAVNMCTGVYMSVGFFGYVAYYKLPNLSGNVLLSFTPNASSEMIKFGFVLSVAVSFPLVIFPCRASIYSFLFRKAHTTHYESMTHSAMTVGSTHIPEARFRCITLFIIFISLLTAMMSSNIELVLGLVGATIGILICVLMPTYIFVRIPGKQTTERLFAKFLFAVGVCIMFLGTYANLKASDTVDPTVTALPSMFIVQDSKQGEIMKLAESMRINNNFMLQEIDNKIEKPKLEKKIEVNKMRLDYDKKMEERNAQLKANDKIVIGNLNKKDIMDNVSNSKADISIKLSKDSNNNTARKEDKELINGEAIKKEEKEFQNEISAQPKLSTSDMKNHELEILEKLKKQEEEQKKIIQQQEIILKEVIKQNKQLEEIKQKDENRADVEGGKAKTSVKETVDTNKLSNGVGNRLKTNGKLEAIQQKRKRLASSLNQTKPVNNNLSEKIQELNENIKELNRDEIKLSNQINKVNENIVLEAQNENVNKQNEDRKNAIGVNNGPYVNQNIGEVKDGLLGRSVDVVDKNVNDKQLVSQIGLNIPNNIQNPIGVVNSVPNTIGNEMKDKVNENNLDVPKVVSKEPAPNGDVNNIESPPNGMDKHKPSISIISKPVFNEEFIEVEKDLSFRKKTAENKINAAVPIALMLQPSENKDNKPVDHVKTRDILEETRREKRDVRVEPVNPVPPEYEIIKDPVANPADKLNLIDPQLIQASVDLIKKTNLLDSISLESKDATHNEVEDLARSALNENIVNNPINQDNIPTVINSEIPPINIVHANEKSVDIQNNANHANIQNEAYISNGQSSFSDKNIPKTLDKSQDNPVHSKSSKDTLSKDIESSTASDKTIPNNGTLGESKTNVPNLLNINDSIKQTDSINQLNSDLLVNSNRTISSDLNNSNNYVNNVASIVYSNNSAIIVNKDTKSDTNNVSYVNNNVNMNGKTIDTINSSDVNIKDDITNRNIPFVVNNNERINGANGVNSNSVIITNDKISSRDVNRKKILNTNGITHSIDVHSNNDVNINGITNPSDVNNNAVIIDGKTNDKISSSDVNNNFVNTKGITNDKVNSIDVHSNNNVNSNDITNPSDVNNNVVIIDDKNDDKVNSIDVNNNFVNTNGITNDKVNSIDVNINNNKVSNNQNEQCEVSDSNGEDIQVPHLLSNLNHEELMKDLHLESKFKDHVLNNIVADKA
ncbi:hypothetical protein M8J75_015991 [Diaphorina citri]|nr:hypothetical protein M8J75_015991 [Diaphorina citri]